jgi:hypothetical protein
LIYQHARERDEKRKWNKLGYYITLAVSSNNTISKKIKDLRLDTTDLYLSALCIRNEEL